MWRNKFESNNEKETETEVSGFRFSIGWGNNGKRNNGKLQELLSRVFLGFELSIGLGIKLCRNRGKELTLLFRV